MKNRTTIKTDLLAFDAHSKKIDMLGDPLAEIDAYIDFAAPAKEVDRVAPLPVSPQGGRAPYPTDAMVRILVLKRLYNFSDEQTEYQLLDRMSYKLSIKVDSKYKVIRKFKTGTTSVHDGKYFDAIIDRTNTSRDIYADRDYTSTDRERWTKAKAIAIKSSEGAGATSRCPSANSGVTAASPTPEPGSNMCSLPSTRWGQTDPHDRSSAGELCDDDDGGLLQPDAAGVLPEVRN